MTTQGSCFSSPVLGPKLLFTLEIRRLSRSDEKAMAPPLQYSCLENPMDGGAWWAAVHRIAKSRTRLSDFTFTFHFHALKKEMATHSSVLAWRIPGTGEPGGLPSMGSHRVKHDWSDLAAAARSGSLRMKPSIWGPNLHKHLSEIATRDKSESTLILKPIW